MKRGVLCILFLLNVISIHGQQYDCGWYGNKTVKQRNKVFPFNKAKKVLLISYDNYALVYGMHLDSASHTKKYIREWKATVKDSIRIYKTIEEKYLDPDDIEELSNIFINYTLKSKPKGFLTVTEVNCYEPRNSILFLDEKGAVMCCYEVCFECMNSFLWPDPDDVEEYADVEECFPRRELIRELFVKNGITYGTQ
jgi:hypothetical protein